MTGVLYIAVGTLKVHVDDGYVTARVRSEPSIYDDPIRVQIVRGP